MVGLRVEHSIMDRIPTTVDIQKLHVTVRKSVVYLFKKFKILKQR